MNCTDCPYCWKEEDDRFPCCHWEPKCPGDVPLCEEIEQAEYREEE